MKILTKFRVIVLFFILISSIFLVSVFWTIQDMHQAINNNHFANSIVKESFELNIVTYDFVLHHDERPKTQWYLKNDTISKLLIHINRHFKNSNEKAIIEKMLSAYNKISDFFSQLVSFYENNQSSGKEDTYFSAIEERLITQLLINSQSLVSSAFILSEISEKKLDQSQEQIIIHTVLVIVLLSSIITISLLWLSAGIIETMDKEIDHVVEELDQSQTKLMKTLFGLQQLNENLDQEVSKRTAELQSRNQELYEFGYSVTHDLRAPLRAMQGFSIALIEDYHDVLDDEGINFANRINNSAKRMDKLIQDLLIHSRISLDNTKFTKIDLEVCIRDILKVYEEIIDEKKYEITVDLRSKYVKASKLIVDKIISNLIDNAIKFTRHNEFPKIKIWSENNDLMVRLFIEDNGIGIEKTYFDKIFNVFERLHSEEQYIGTGIGLAIVKKGIEKLGGNYGVESKIGKFSIFWIELPIDE